jgi:hypothetical protein
VEVSGKSVKRDYLIGYARCDCLEKLAWGEGTLDRISENVEQLEIAVVLRELREGCFHWHEIEVMNFLCRNDVSGLLVSVGLSVIVLLQHLA